MRLSERLPMDLVNNRSRIRKRCLTSSFRRVVVWGWGSGTHTCSPHVTPDVTPDVTPMWTPL